MADLLLDSPLVVDEEHQRELGNAQGVATLQVHTGRVQLTRLSSTMVTRADAKVVTRHQLLCAFVTPPDLRFASARVELSIFDPSGLAIQHLEATAHQPNPAVTIERGRSDHLNVGHHSVAGVDVGVERKSNISYQLSSFSVSCIGVGTPNALWQMSENKQAAVGLPNEYRLTLELAYNNPVQSLVGIVAVVQGNTASQRFRLILSPRSGEGRYPVSLPAVS